MRTLNLVDLEKSDIKYKISKFPDGQQNIVIEKVDFKHDIHSGIGLILKEPIQIKSRLNNWLDLELITCAVASLRELGVEEIHLYTPYIMGARSDRKFGDGGNNYLKDVICPIINSLNFKTVTCIDPHSYSLECCIKNFKSIDNSKLVNFAIDNIVGKFQYKPINGVYSNEDLKNIILISPDAGASKKIYKLAEQIGYKGDIITCSKDRDTDGKLTKCVVPNFDLSKDIIIIDDIFDFGGTFKAIGGIMNDMGHQGKKYLIVTHSIQTDGLKDALKWFDGIFTTNSYKEHNLEKIKVLNIF